MPRDVRLLYKAQSHMLRDVWLFDKAQSPVAIEGLNEGLLSPVLILLFYVLFPFLGEEQHGFKLLVMLKDTSQTMAWSSLGDWPSGSIDWEVT